MAEAPLSLMDGDVYRRIAGHWLTGVAIVTSHNGVGAPVGLTMSAVTPLSLSPPLFLVCLNLGSETLLAIEASRRFAINILGHDGVAACQAFARKGSDKFAGVASRTGAFGVPILDGAIAHVECLLHEVFVVGDHKMVVGAAVAGDVTECEPIAYYRGAFHKLQS